MLKNSISNLERCQLKTFICSQLSGQSINTFTGYLSEYNTAISLNRAALTLNQLKEILIKAEGLGCLLGCLVFGSNFSGIYFSLTESGIAWLFSGGK